MLSDTLRDLVNQVRWRVREREWKKDRTGPVPPTIKQRNVRERAAQYNLRVLVETGTFRGDMVEAMRRHFDRIYSIELSPELHRRAAKRFGRYPHIEIICGDSAAQLQAVVSKLKEPALFWLDAHYSGGVTARADSNTPICREIAAVLDSPYPHVVMIDDASSFGVGAEYPTIAEVTALIQSKRKAEIQLVDDVIQAVLT